MIRFAAVCLAGVAFAGIRAAEPTPKEQEERFYGHWMGVEKTKAGVSTKSQDDLVGHFYSRKGSGGWALAGEYVSWDGLPPRIDATKTPMRVDFLSDDMPGAGRPKKRTVLPCIFKFDGDNLVIAYGTAWSADVPPKEGEDFPGRPADFTSTKENGVTVVISKPSSYLARD